MASLELTRTLAATTDDAFAVFSDVERTPERVGAITSLEMLTPGPLGVGSRWRETRQFMGKEVTEEMEVTGFDPPRRFTVECTSHGTHTVSTFHFTPSGGGTELRVELETRPVTMAAKLFSPIGKMLMGTLRKCMEQDFDELEQHLPGASTSP